MARQARIVSKTGYYHVIVRGNNRAFVFSETYEKEFFLKNLMIQQEEGLIQIAAWCIMDNHVHLILKAEPDDLAKAFKKINVRFAVRYHLRHNTTGHIFQDRFKSEPIETDEYLVHVARYVHNNPVKAGMVEEPALYNWSSYKRYLSSSDEFNDVMRFIFELIGRSVEQFIDFHNQEDDEKYLDIEEDIERERERRFQKIIVEACNRNGIAEKSEIVGCSKVFDGVIVELVNESGYSIRKVAKKLNVSYNRVHRSYVSNNRTIKMDRPQ